METEVIGGATGGGLLGVVVQILNLGLIGLAFLMMYLGYRALTKELAKPGAPHKESLATIKFFLVVSLVFTTLVAVNGLYGRKVPVNLLIQPSEADLTVWGTTYGDVTITDGHGRVQVTDSESLVVSAKTLMDKLRDTRKDLIGLTPGLNTGGIADDGGE